MDKFFLEDIIDKVTKRGAFSCNTFYNIIIPKLSNTNTVLVLDHKSKYRLVDFKVFTYKNLNVTYTIRTEFSDYFKDEYMIDHSFHKCKISGYSDLKDNMIETDLYFNNNSIGFTS